MKLGRNQWYKIVSQLLTILSFSLEVGHKGEHWGKIKDLDLNKMLDSFASFIYVY